MHFSRLAACAAAAALPTLAAASSNVEPANKFAWSENAGWLNWRDANAGAQGAVIGPAFLSGFVWGENIGWINLGDGSPVGGSAYSNSSGADFGVNIGPGGALNGLAWGENIGWINFNTSPSLGAGQGARYDAAARRLRGWAWGENIGWINLDHGTHYVGVQPSCAADLNGDGAVTASDLSLLLTSWGPAPGNPADLNGDGNVNASDLGLLLTSWGPCP